MPTHLPKPRLSELTGFVVFVTAGLEPDQMSSLACQFMDVMYIPKEIDNILRDKSHGVPSWCEQLIKEILLSKIIQIVPESKVFIDNDNEDDDDNVSEPLSFAPIDKLRDKYFELTVQNIPNEGKQNRPDSPFLRSRTPALPNLSEDDEDELLLAQETGDRRTSFFTKLMTNERRMSADSAISSVTTTSETPKLAAIKRRSSLPQQDSSSRLAQTPRPQIPTIDCLGYLRSRFVPAAENAMPRNTYSVCIVTPGVDLSNVVIPDSVKDMVLARVDRMSPTEQITLKCASILGMLFSRDLVEALVPLTCRKSLDLILYTLVRDGILECASLAAQHQSAHNHHGFYDYNDPAHAHHHTHHHHHHHHQNVATSLHAPVLCGCYADEGNKVRRFHITSYNILFCKF